MKVELLNVSRAVRIDYDVSLVQK